MAYSIEQRDDQLIDTQAAIRYTLRFPNAAQHIVHVTMEVDTSAAAELVLALPSWIPGSYKVRDFIANQGNVIVADESGQRLDAEWISKSRMRVTTEGIGRVVITYTYFGNERTVRQTHINRFHAFLNPANALMFVEGRTEEIHHVTIEHPWSKVSTSLSPVRVGTWGALNYDILIDSPIEIGDHYVATYERHGAMHEIAITGHGDFDPDWLAEQTKIIVDEAVKMWGPLPYDRYVFIIQLLPGAYGGLEHARSSVNMFDSQTFSDREKTVKLLVLLCHEYFHLWNVKRIRPVELGPFDYHNENYTRMLWLAEGVTSYYDDLMAYRCGFHSRESYLKALSEEHIGRLLDVAGRRVMSIKDSSYLSWVKLYMPTADSSNRFPSYYLKGGVIFLLLDMWIIAQTDGARSLDDGMRALMAHYVASPEAGVTEEEFIRIVSDATGVEIGERLRTWLDGTDELPVEEIAAMVGLEWRRKETDESPTFGADLPFPKSDIGRWIGVQVEEVKSGLKVVSVWSDSPAEAAGIGADDELLAVDGMRVTSVKAWEVAMRAARRASRIRVTAASEGRMFETDIQPVPRVSHELAERADASEIERQRLEKWLHRG